MAMTRAVGVVTSILPPAASSSSIASASCGLQRKKPCAVLAAELAEHRELLGVLDALGDRAQPQRLREADDGPGERRLLGAAGRCAGRTTGRSSARRSGSAGGS